MIVPKVSIITPCYNCDRFIGQTIESVQAQTFTDWEHIIVDDGSTDASAAVVQQYCATEDRLQLIQQFNQGVAKARNQGLVMTSPESDYLFFLDADDCLEPTMLAVLIAYLEQHPEVGLAYCNYKCIDEAGTEIETHHFDRYVSSGLGVRALSDQEPNTPFMSVFAPAVILPSVSLIRRSAYEQTPGWDESFGQPFEDTDLNLHLALCSEIHYVPQTLVRHRRHSTQSTSSQEKLAQQQQKLYQKWLNLDDLAPDQKALVKQAWQFREGRLIPSVGFYTSQQHWQQGNFLTAMRFYGGAVRRYAASFFVKA